MPTHFVSLPGSEKAARENLLAVLKAIRHGVDMLYSEGSAECAAQPLPPAKQKAPSMDLWLQEAKVDQSAGQCGMYLFHNGVVRQTAKAQARLKLESKPVAGMQFSYDSKQVSAAIEKARQMTGIYYVRVWLNEGQLDVGDDIMLVLIGCDIRPNVIHALQALVEDIKTNCVKETELY